MNTTSHKPLLTVQQAADILGVSPVTLIRWEKEGRVTLIHLPGPKSLRMAQEELDRLLSMTVARGE